VVALGETRDGTSAIRFLAEVKWSSNAFGTDAIDRLTHARDLLGGRGHNVASCELALISRAPSSTAGYGLRIGLDQLYE
jgi:hypothetical protein